jgi:hypothetical protein
MPNPNMEKICAPIQHGNLRGKTAAIQMSLPVNRGDIGEVYFTKKDWFGAREITAGNATGEGVKESPDRTLRERASS